MAYVCVNIYDFSVNQMPFFFFSKFAIVNHSGFSHSLWKRSRNPKSKLSFMTQFLPIQSTQRTAGSLSHQHRVIIVC